jgi:hypothetical protein
MGLSFEQSPPLPARGLNRLEQYGIRLVQAFSEACSTSTTMGRTGTARLVAESSYEDENLGTYSDNGISSTSSKTLPDADLRAVIDKRREEGKLVGRTDDEIDREKKAKRLHLVSLR